MVAAFHNYNLQIVSSFQKTVFILEMCMVLLHMSMQSDIFSD